MINSHRKTWFFSFLIRKYLTTYKPKSRNQSVNLYIHASRDNVNGKTVV